MPGREYSDGLHQAIEAKENVQIKQETTTLATITYQNFLKNSTGNVMNITVFYMGVTLNILMMEVMTAENWLKPFV